MVAASIAAHAFTAIDLPTSLLAFAIGGTAEMVLTAKAVGADAALVTAFQAIRGLFGNAFAAPVFRAVVAPRLAQR